MIILSFMSKGLLVTFGVGIVVVIAIVAYVLQSSKGAHLVPTGSILKVRTQKLDDADSALVVDLRLSNNADFPMTIRSIDLALEKKDGSSDSGNVIAASDLANLFQYYPLLGDRFNEALKARDHVPPHQSIDRMVAWQFTMPEADLQSRRKITIRIEDVTGPVAELTAK